MISIIRLTRQPFQSSTKRKLLHCYVWRSFLNDNANEIVFSERIPHHLWCLVLVGSSKSPSPGNGNWMGLIYPAAEPFSPRQEDATSISMSEICFARSSSLETWMELYQQQKSMQWTHPREATSLFKSEACSTMKNTSRLDNKIMTRQAFESVRFSFFLCLKLVPLARHLQKPEWNVLWREPCYSCLRRRRCHTVAVDYCRMASGEIARILVSKLVPPPVICICISFPSDERSKCAEGFAKDMRLPCTIARRCCRCRCCFVHCTGERAAAAEDE